MQKKQIMILIGWIVLILAMIIAIEAIFMFLDRTISPASSDGSPPANQSQLIDREPPSFCPYCGKALYSGFQWGQFCPYCGNKIESTA